MAQPEEHDIMNIKNLHKLFLQSNGVTTDSRAIKGGEIFIALKGENFDGNAYALKALESGAAYAVVDADSEAAKSSDKRIIIVENTLIALQALAREHRSAARVAGKPLQVIGLTGTNGKTTTKELIRSVLSTKYTLTATEGNLNNSIGVPLTLLKINEATELAVVEMGASHPGDIKELVDIALPDFGLITNVGKAHLLGFGSFEGVKNTKGELYDYLSANAGKVLLNLDNPHLVEMAQQRGFNTSAGNCTGYGLNYSGAEVLPSSAEHPFLRIRLTNGEILETQLVGSYNADNVMAAIAVGAEFEISSEEAAAAIAAYSPSNNRSQMTKTEANTLIVDAYNANPTSMEAALDNFTNVHASKKIAMLGDMRELGEESEKEHIMIAEKALGLGLSKVIFVGEEFGKILSGEFAKTSSSEWEHYADSQSLAEAVEKKPICEAVILIKGSRGIKMENVICKL